MSISGQDGEDKDEDVIMALGKHDMWEKFQAADPPVWERPVINKSWVNFQKNHNFGRSGQENLKIFDFDFRL